MGFGAVVARAPRAAVDCNRCEDEIDPTVVRAGPLPPLSPRARSGLGIVPGRTMSHGPLWRHTIARHEEARATARPGAPALSPSDRAGACPASRSLRLRSCSTPFDAAAQRPGAVGDHRRPLRAERRALRDLRSGQDHHLHRFSRGRQPSRSPAAMSSSATALRNAAFTHCRSDPTGAATWPPRASPGPVLPVLRGCSSNSRFGSVSSFSTAASPLPPNNKRAARHVPGRPSSGRNAPVGAAQAPAQRERTGRWAIA